METPFTRESVIADFTEAKAQLVRELDALSRTLVSANWVIQVGSLYAKLTVDENHIVQDCTLGGIRFAHRLSRVDAERVGSGIVNGLGQVGRAVQLRQAYRDSISSLDQSIAFMQERAA